MTSKKELNVIQSTERELLKKVKQQLPYGACSLISKKLKISNSQLTRFFNGASSPRKADILNATAEYLKEYNAKDLQAMKAITNALRPESPEQLQARLKHQSEKMGKNKSPLLEQ